MCARYTLTVDLTQLQQRFSFVAEELPYISALQRRANTTGPRPDQR